MLTMADMLALRIGAMWPDVVRRERAFTDWLYGEIELLEKTCYPVEKEQGRDDGKNRRSD